MNRILYFLAFALGLAVVSWVGVGYVALSPLALAVTAIIALVYIVGALELYRYQQATGTLERALDGLSETPANLAGWLSKLDPSLRDAARARVEGERVGLPGPSLTPYLVGLLVLLGMLGTFLGMVATLRGTGLALESASDLQAIRSSLAVPITGLGFAFGTSVAGVATSAMLGLLSAFCRRDRARAARKLDARAATTLRIYSQAHQREESLRLLQEQAQALPLVADRLQAMVTAIELHSQSLSDKLVAGQEAFHAKSDARHEAMAQQNQALSERLVAGQEALQEKSEEAFRAIQQHTLALNERLGESQEALNTKNEAAYAAMEAHSRTLVERLAAGQESLHAKTDQAFSKLIASAEKVHAGLVASAEKVHSNLATAGEAAYIGLASSVEESLKRGVAESAQAAGMAIKPVVESTFEKLARENAALQENIGQSVQRVLDGLSSRAEQSAAKSEQSLAHAASLWTEALVEHKRVSESLVDEQRRISVSLIQQSQLTNDSMLKTQQEAGAALVQEHSRAGQTLIEAQQSAAEALVKALQSANESFIKTQQEAGETQAEVQRSNSESLASHLRSSLDAFAETFELRSAALVDKVASRLDETNSHLAEGWSTALKLQQSASEKLADDNRQALTTAIAALEQHAASLVHQVGESNGALREVLVSQDAARLAAWAEAFASTTATLRDEWRKAAETTENRQKEICDALARTADDIARQSREHASGTIAEIERLVTAASEAPKVAAEVVAEVRDKLSDSMARDNAMLEERGRMLETLATLLDAVNHASNEQRTAVDALLTSSSDLLDRIGTQVADKVEAEAGKLGYMASQVSGSAIEIATLGDSFGKAVQSFSESNASLMQHLQRVEETLERSIVRSDEQLAYYVAQAREVIDLSLLSQKQILEQLQQASGSVQPAESARAGAPKQAKGAATP